MKKFLFLVALILNISCLPAFAIPTGWDKTPTNESSFQDSSSCDEFPAIWPTSNSDVYEIMERVGSTRESDAGSIYNFSWTYSTLAQTTPTLLFSCPDVDRDATNPTYGRIGNTLYVLVDCKKVDNSASKLYVGTRALSGSTSSWSFSLAYDSPTCAMNGWGDLNATSDSNTYFWPISTGCSGYPITQLRTTNAGTSWVIGPHIITNPSYWSELASKYVPGVGHIGFVRNDNGDHVNYIKSTDGLGITWTAPAPISSNAYGAATGVKVGQMYYDSASGTLLGSYADRGDSNSLYISATKPFKAFNGVWETPKSIGQTGFGNQVFQEVDTTNKYFFVLIGDGSGSPCAGSCCLRYLIYQDLIQSLNFGHIVP